MSFPLFRLSVLVGFCVLCMSNSFGQTGDGCDSLHIAEIRFNPDNSEELLLTVENYSNDFFFKAPNFMIFKNETDTIAIEKERDHEDIQKGTQTHRLKIIHQPELPVAGYIRLYTENFQVYQCFSYHMLEDTVPLSCDSFDIGPFILDSTGEEGMLTINNKNKPTIFLDYPSMYMLDENEKDTLATHEVFLFGLGFGHSSLNFKVNKTFSYPQKVIYHLYSGFEAKLECVFDFTLEDPSGKNEISQEPSFHLFPNPSSGSITIKNRKGSLNEIKIFNQLGAVVIAINNDQVQTVIDCSQLPKGTYIVQLKDNKGTLLHRKLVLE